MAYLGIIAWLLILVAVVYGANPILVILILLVGAVLALCGIISQWRLRKTIKSIGEKPKKTREELIDEWEKKYGKIHPTRKYKR